MSRCDLMLGLAAVLMPMTAPKVHDHIPMSLQVRVLQRPLAMLRSHERAELPGVLPGSGGVQPTPASPAHRTHPGSDVLGHQAKCCVTRSLTASILGLNAVGWPAGVVLLCAECGQHPVRPPPFPCPPAITTAPHTERSAALR